MGSIRANIEESLARQQEWGTDNGPYFIGPGGAMEDMRGWDDKKWAEFEIANGTASEEDMALLSSMDMDLTRLKNYK